MDRFRIGMIPSSLLGLAAFGGVIATPALAAGVSGACDYNPALLEKGNTYTTISKITEDGRAFSVEKDYKVMGSTRFHGHKVIDVRSHTHPYPSGKVSPAFDVFYKISSKFIYNYGHRGPAGEQYDDPPNIHPRHYVINAPYTSTFVAHVNNDRGFISSYTVHMTSTFLGMQSVTVPAGTFVACKMRTATSMEGPKPTGIGYSWFVASGRHASLLLKFINIIDTAPGAPAAVTSKWLAISLRFNGK